MQAELACDKCSGRLAALAGDKVLEFPDRADSTGVWTHVTPVPRTMVWSSPPREGCLCRTSVARDNLAYGVRASSKLLASVQHATHKSICDRIKGASRWTSRAHQQLDDSVLPSAQVRQVLDFADTAIEGLESAQDALDEYDDAFDRLEGTSQV